MSHIYQYINNESILGNSINSYEAIFNDYINNPPSLKEALLQMFISSGLTKYKSDALINQIISKVREHLDKNFSSIQEKYSIKITYEDAQIISSYTCELNEKYKIYNPYSILNKNLVSNNRENGIRNVSKYLFSFLKALRKLDIFRPEKKKIFI